MQLRCTPLILALHGIQGGLTNHETVSIKRVKPLRFSFQIRAPYRFSHTSTRLRLNVGSTTCCTYNMNTPANCSVTYLVDSSPVLFVVFQHPGPQHVHYLWELLIHKGRSAHMEASVKVN